MRNAQRSTPNAQRPMILALCALLVASTAAHGAFSYYKTITIDETKCGSNDSSNFPVLFATTHNDFKSVGNGGHVQSSSGFDIAFYNASGKLDHELERYNATTGEVVAWVRVPTLSSSVDTVLYILYGDATITSDLSNRIGVWDANYKGVWHLKDGTTLSGADSTANGNNGTLTNTPGAAAGKVDGAASFTNASHNHIDMTGASLDVTGTALTVSCWANYSASGLCMVSHRNSAPNRQYQLSHTGTNFQMVIFDGTNNDAATGATATSSSTWYYVVGVKDGTGANALKVYVNGGQDGAATSNKSMVTSTAQTRISGMQEINSFDWSGSLDEVRVSNVARGADWITAEYNNQNDPGTFYSLGSETAVPVTTYGYYRSVTFEESLCGSADSTDFPALVSVTDNSFKTTGNGGRINSADGNDITFYADSAKTTKLTWEKETWDGSTGALKYWVKIPTLSTSADTVIYCFYSGTTSAPFGVLDESNPAGVWDSNYLAVYHLKDGSTLSARDSTSNAHNGTITSTTPTTGQVDGGAHFDGSNDRIDSDNIAANTSFTVEAWMKPTNTSVANEWAMGQYQTTAKGWGIKAGGSGGSQAINFYDDGPAGNNIAETIFTDANFHHIVFAGNATNLLLYRDGTLNTTFSVTIFGSGAPTAGFVMGTVPLLAGGFFLGDLDEVRLSNVKRGADWVTASYNNQSNPGTFETLGGETAFGASTNVGFFLFFP